jgi:toluene monooxygenase system protein A
MLDQMPASRIGRDHPMALLKREEWQGFVRDVDWSYRYVDDEAVYPEWMSGTGKVPRQAWLAWEESYKVSYPEYVATQRDKEAAAYAVKAALQRSKVWDSLTEGWKSATKMHFGGTAASEYAAVLAELKMARFGLAGSWRNMAVFGQLDELRHASITTFFGHEFVSQDPQYDWTQKTYQTNNWVAISLRNLFDAMMSSANVVDIALQLPLVFETGFTNLQFVALAADALASGDVNFANMISSIQTDEARHSQQGGPTLEILVEHDPARAQWVVDKTFWASARALSALTGTSMDYYTPLEHRKQSYREFMEEWIIDQFIRTVEQYGLRKPWYWDEFMRGLDTWHHSLHMGFWVWRPTIWWRPMAAVSPDERAWLVEKYPNWEKVYGDKWDVIIDNVNSSNTEATLPETLPWLCSTCHLPACNATQSRDGTWRVRDVPLTYDGRTYHFCTKACRQIFWKDRGGVNHQTLVDRFLAGQIQPMDVGGILGYMGLTPDVMGDDPDYEAWTRDYAGRPADGIAVARS